MRFLSKSYRLISRAWAYRLTGRRLGPEHAKPPPFAPWSQQFTVAPQHCPVPLPRLVTQSTASVRHHVRTCCAQRRPL